MYQFERGNKRILNILSKLMILVVIVSILTTSAFGATGTSGEAKEIIENYYVNELPAGLDSETSVEDMVEALDDPYSAYFTPEEYQGFVDAINNKFVGIGIGADKDEEGVRVISVFQDSPAEEAGLEEGDIIVEADGFILGDMSLDEAISHIKGPEGTAVTLRVKRGTSYNTYEITRREISLPTVEGEMMNDSIGYISIVSFGENTAGEFGRVLGELQNNDPDSYIIDLRNNGGGYMHTAIELAGYFIGEKTALITRDKDGIENKYTAPEVEVIDKPVIFLVNEYSASSSEILTAAVKDYDKAFLVGTNTYGKGVAQTMFQLSDGSVIKITSEKFYSPFGNEIDKVGIKPDLEVGEEDALEIALLLLGKSGDNADKRGFAKVTLDNREFEIDLELARLPELWGAYRKIIESLPDNTSAKIGKSTGWYGVDDDYSENMWKMYYPKYDETEELNNVVVDKEFTIRFSDSVDPESIDDQSIELINSGTGERTYLFTNIIDESTVKAIPQGGLQPGNEYYIVIHDSIVGKRGQKLKKGTVTEITVE